MTFWKRLRDLSLEVLVALVLVTGGIVYVALNPTGNQHWEVIAFAVNTTLVFGFLISWFRNAWRSGTFWATVAALLLGHSGGYWLILSRIERFPLAYYVALNSMELAFFTLTLRWLVAHDSDRGHFRNGRRRDG